MSKISLQQPTPAPLTTTTAGTKHVPAALVLIAGTAASLLFGRDRIDPQSPPIEAGERLVRRIQTPREMATTATMQLLGYAEDGATRAGGTLIDAVQTGGVETGVVQVDNPRFGGPAPVEPRTAARIDTTAVRSELPSYGRMLPTALTAAAGPPPRAVMQPYPTTNDSSVSRPEGAASAVPAPPPIGRPSFDRPGLSALPANAPRRHRISDGDTLVGLAERYYGDAARFRDIFEANRGTLTHPELLPIGATLNIPGYDPQESRPIAPPAAARLVPQVLYRGP